MASPLAVLSEAAYAYEQMEKLNQLKVNKNNIFQVKVSRVHGDDGVFILNFFHYLNFFYVQLASSPVASSIANSYGALGAYGPGAYGATPSAMPMLLVVPSLYGLNSQNQALLHQQAAALSGLNPAFYPSGLTSSPTHSSQGQTHAAAYGIAPQPPTNLVLNASLSTGNRSLGSEESDLPPWHVPREVPPAQPSSPKAPVKTSTIVRNPTHNSAPSGEIQKVKMRQKKVRNQVDHHFRRSLGSNYETPVLKKRPATIAYSEVRDC